MREMRIDPVAYYKSLSQRFNANSIVFCNLIDYFDSFEKVGGSSIFVKYCDINKIESSSEFYDWLYEFYNNLCRYFDGGVFNLFKTKQSEWGAPRVNIQRVDVPKKSDVNSLNDPQIIYRGLSHDEHQNKDYAQSWTVDINEAKKFANDTYYDELQGIVVMAEVKRINVIYFDNSDPEKETIIEKGCKIQAKVI